MTARRIQDGRPSSLAESKNYSPSTHAPARSSKNDPNASGSTGDDEEEFSYAKLSSMWKEKDKQRLEITPPTSRTPLTFSTHSSSTPNRSVPTPKKSTTYPYRANQTFRSNMSTKPTFPLSNERSNVPVTQKTEIGMTSPYDADTSIPDEEITSNLTMIQANIPLYQNDENDESKNDEIENLTPKQLWSQKDKVEHQHSAKRPNFMSNLPNAGSDESDNDDESHDDEEIEQIMAAQMKYGVPYHNQTVNSPETGLKSMQKRALSNFQMELPPKAPKKAPNPSKHVDEVHHRPSVDCITPMKPKVLTLDPYDALDSMSMVNSEVTVQMENKQSTTFLNAFEKRRESIASDLLEVQYDMASHIPDSAFGISAAVLQKLANGRDNGHVPKSESVRSHVAAQHHTDVQSHNNNNDFKEEDNLCYLSEPGSDKGRMDLNESNIKMSNIHEHGSLWNNAPKVEHDASSDVFDGLSEVMSSSVFGKLPQTQSSSFQNHQLTTKNKMPTEETSSRLSTSSSNRNSSTNGVSRPRQRSMERERNEEAKKRFSENLAAFAKKVTTSEQKSSIPSLQKIVSSSVSSKKSKASVINLYTALASTLEDVSEGEYSEQENHLTDGPSGYHENIIGISRLHVNDNTSVDKADYLLEVLTTPVQGDSKKKSMYKDTQMPDSTDETQDDESFGSYGAMYVSMEKQKNLSESDSKIGWVPSILRLYKMHDFSPPKSDRSPTSAIHFDEATQKDFEVSIDDCRLRGLQSIILFRGLRFGGKLDDPSRIIGDGRVEMKRSTISKLKHFNSVKLKNGKALPRNRYHIFEKMTEIHETALKYIQKDKKDEALEVYESFFESYSNQELISHDRGQEKRIISTILYNMGVLYLALDECKLALDFFKEARVTFEDSDSDERYLNDMGAIYNAIGVAQFACREYSKALMILADSLAIRQSMDDKLGMVESLSNVGCVYVALEEIDAANQSMEEALEVARSYCKSCFHKKENHENVDIQRALSNTADVLSNMSYLYHFKCRSVVKSKFLLEEALSIYKSIEFREDMCDTLKSHIIFSASDFCEV